VYFQDRCPYKAKTLALVEDENICPITSYFLHFSKGGLGEFERVGYRYKIGDKIKY